MKQSCLGLGPSTKRTRRREFLDEMDRVVPWSDLVAQIAPFMPEGKRGRPPFPVESLLRIHFMQQWFTLISAPSSTKNASGERDPEMHQSKKGQQWFFGMKAHIGVDADSGLVHTVRGTSGNVNDVVEANSLLHGQETDVFADAGYQGAHKRPDAKDDVQWHVAMRPGLRKLLDKADPMDALTDQVERIKASIRAKVEHPFRVIKRQFGHVKVRYRGLAKNTAQLHTLFALANLWMVRKRLTGSLA
jgi:transposase, IS5 family